MLSIQNLFESVSYFKPKYFVNKFVLSSQPRNYLRNYFLQFSRGNHTDLHWKEPDGYETGVSIYNSLSKSKVPFKTLQPGVVTWYNCGPTVYDSAHIGHAVCYVKLDIIRRILQNIFHLDVLQVTGVTDIDDKILKRAQELNVSAKNLTQHYEKEFFHHMSQLNVLPPSVIPRVTEHIPQIISFIENIMAKGLAYDVGDGTIYFDTTAYGRYGKLMKFEKDVKRIAFDERKKSSKDFALWKGTKESDLLSWKSPWGEGRPGWHIECSVMASRIFGNKLDLHSGGSDLLFPHHENEEAQCCAHHSCDQWCNYWIHIGHLHLKDSTKMSKSLYNTISLEEYLQEYSSNVFRLFCLLSHFKSQIGYDSSIMSSSLVNLKKIKSFFVDSYAYVAGRKKCGVFNDTLIMQKLLESKKEVKKALADDFNTKEAMHIIFELMALCNKEFSKTEKQNVTSCQSFGTVMAVCGYIENFLSSVGLQFENHVPVENKLIYSDQNFSRIIDSTVEFRHEVKNYSLLKNIPQNEKETLSKEEKNQMKKERSQLLTLCDELRDTFKNNGVQIKDYEEGSSWNYTRDTTVSDIPLEPARKEKNTKR